MNEILDETGCRLVEIGTTNRTSLDDYRQAMVPGATVLKVHRSNFAVEGFTEDVDLPELAEACREAGCTLIYDAGSGVLYPMRRAGPAGGRAPAGRGRGHGRGPGHLQRGQAAGRLPGGHRPGSPRADRRAAQAPHAAGLPGRQDDPGRPGRGAERLPGGRGTARGADHPPTGDGRGAASAAGRAAAGRAGAPRPGRLAGRRGAGRIERRRRLVQHRGHGLEAGAVAGREGRARGLPPPPAHRAVRPWWAA